MITLDQNRRRRTFKECFAHFGIVLKNQRRVPWASLAPDGRVVVTLWDDQFTGEGSVYTIFDRSDLSLWRNESKAKDRTALLKHVGRSGKFESIILKAVDNAVYPRAAKEKYIGPAMCLIELNETTGEFSAQQVC